MHLTPRESERLLLSAGADLARRRLARGAYLSAPDAVALVCDEICEMAWDGLPLSKVIDRARRIVSVDQLVAGVGAAVPSIEIEALFPHGSVLVHVDQPFGPPEADDPGAILVGAESIELAPGRTRSATTIHNSGTRAIWVTSHVPLSSVNKALQVSIPHPEQWRLDVPSGVSVKVAPGQSRQVDVVEIEVAQ